MIEIILSRLSVITIIVITLFGLLVFIVLDKMR